MSQRKILVVDDYRLFREVLVSFLEINGVDKSRIEEAGDGNEALEIIEKEADNYSVVITDVNMPRMDGLELGKKIGEKFPEIKVIYASAGVSPLPGITFIHKPFSIYELAELMKEYL